MLLILLQETGNLGEWVKGAASGTGFVIIVLLVLWKIGIIVPRNGNGNGKTPTAVTEPTAGQMSEGAWTKIFRELNRESEERTEAKMLPMLTRLGDLMSDQKAELRGLREDIRDLTKSINGLIGAMKQ